MRCPFHHAQGSLPLQTHFEKRLTWFTRIATKKKHTKYGQNMKRKISVQHLGHCFNSNFPIGDKQQRPHQSPDSLPLTSFWNGPNLVFQTGHGNRKIPTMGRIWERKCQFHGKREKPNWAPYRKRRSAKWSSEQVNLFLYLHPNFEAVFKGTSPGKTARKRAKAWIPTQ